MNNGLFSTRKPKLYSSIYDQKPVVSSTQPAKPPVGAIGQTVTGGYIMPKSPQPTPQPKIEIPKPQLTPLQETSNLQNEAANTNVKYITDLYNQRAKTYQAQVDPMKDRFNQYKQAQEDAIREAEKAAEAERQAQEQQYGGELRQSAQAGRESRARVANEFAGYNTLDSSAYGKALVGQEENLRVNQANIRANQSRAGLQTQRELSGFKREANNAIANEASKLQDKLNEIDQLLGEGSIEKDRAIAEAYQTARQNILTIRQQLATTESELNKYKVSQEYLQTGVPSTMADYIFRQTEPEKAKKFEEMLGAGGQDDSGKRQIIDTIENIRSGNIGGITGLGQYSFIPGTQAAMTKNYYDQLKGLLSLENRQKLKGSGAISDFEAKTLDQAASALGRNLSETQFRNILDNIYTAFGGQNTGNVNYSKYTQ